MQKLEILILERQYIQTYRTPKTSVQFRYYLNKDFKNSLSQLLKINLKQ